jgi:hypothetical protein
MRRFPGDRRATAAWATVARAACATVSRTARAGVLLAACVGGASLAGTAIAAGAPPSGPLVRKALARMPVKEVTVFKDGHAFMLHAGRMTTDEAGNVVLDQLPSPVIGTFWPYVADRRAKLASVTAGSRDVLVEHTALELRELIEGNAGAPVIVTESKGASYKATILGVPSPDRDEQRRAPEPGAERSPERAASVVLLETENGTKVVRLDQIQDVRFTGSYRKTVTSEERRNLLTLRLDWGGKPEKDAEVGLVYLQRGIRWIPGYRVAIDGKGRALIRLQATLVNELADLDDVTAHLVVGIPSFELKDTPDPIALQQAVAELSQSFQRDARTAFAFSNAIMTQQLATPLSRGHVAEPAATSFELGPDVAESGGHEDLFVFTLEHVSLRKGERAVLPVAEFALKYRDVFALDVPLAPPTELWRSLGSDRQAELARLFGSSRVTHRIRLANSSALPLTTAPALILRDERLLAQGLMTYAAPGAETDLTITPVVDISVRKEDHEVKRVPNAATWQGEQYGRVELQGALTLTSYRKEPVEVEITRHVLGNALSADSAGRTELVNALEDGAFLRTGDPRPYWWDVFSWPWWWAHFNGVSRVTWTVHLEPRKPLALGYTWEYYWR